MKYVLLVAVTLSLGGCFAAPKRSAYSGPARYGYEAAVYNNLDYTYQTYKDSDPRYNRAMRDGG